MKWHPPRGDSTHVAVCCAERTPSAKVSKLRAPCEFRQDAPRAKLRGVNLEIGRLQGVRSLLLVFRTARLGGLSGDVLQSILRSAREDCDHARRNRDGRKDIFPCRGHANRGPIYDLVQNGAGKGDQYIEVYEYDLNGGLKGGTIKDRTFIIERLLLLANLP